MHSCSGDRAGQRLRRVASRGMLLVVGLLAWARSDAGAQERVSPARRDSLAGALFAAAMRADSLGDLDKALAGFRRALARATAVQDAQTLGDAWHNGGVTHWTRANYDSALVWLQQAQRFRELSGDRAAYGRTMNTLGSSYYQLGQYGPALEAFFRSLTVWQQAHDSVGVVRTQVNIGKTFHDWGQLDRAQQVLKDAEALARQLPGRHTPLGYALNSLAMLAIDRGDYAAVPALVAESRENYSPRHADVTRADSAGAWSLNTSAEGLLRIRQGRPSEALPLLDSVYQVAVARRSVRGLARVQLYIGEAHAAMGHTREAREALQASLEASASVSQRILSLAALRQLATLEEKAGNSRLALARLRAYQALRDTVFDQDAAQRIAVMQARVETDRARLATVQLREAQRTQDAIIARQRTAVGMGGVILLLALSLAGVLVYTNHRGRQRELALGAANAGLNDANTKLRGALSEVRTLSGLIPICAHCKNVRDDQGYWAAVETYVSQHSDARFSHGICQSCGPALYGELWGETEGGGSSVAEPPPSRAGSDEPHGAHQ
ncbi:MAG: tetratricopeptide repeat protein [Gemmatimonadaceae bacterium]|nr:tetratricopeptide repeat protein [Gemmatimonadaceae bacterium]